MGNMNTKKYQYMQIGIASPEEIRSWAYRPEDGFYGEVKKHETINYRTQKPERDGLFCEVIFGPTKDNQCACGRQKKSLNGEHRICERCKVEITESKVRREKMGYIELAAPVVHTWYLRNTPSKIAILLDMKTKDVEDIVYLASYIITQVSDDYVPEDDEEEATLYVGKIITEQENAALKRRYFGKFKAMTGAEAIKHLLKQVNLQAIADDIEAELKIAPKGKKEKLIKRLEITKAFLESDNKPEWMVMDVIPVIPPDLRPMVQLDGGRFATTDLNDLYRRIINRNTRLRKQFEVRAPDLIVKNEKRMLQEAVDALIDNSKRNKRMAMEKNRPLKSLSDILRGKQGRFRQNLLGKRADYSGRSVIIIGPDLKMYQCGIPREMGLILFKPFIINYLRQKEKEEAAKNPFDATMQKTEKAGIRKAKELIERGAPEAIEALEKVIVEHPVLLNRAPTLHRLSIQAFEPKLVEGKAIRLHPLVTTAFNADFDGDQMPIHVPLSQEAQAEARMLMLASKNILAPKDGKPIVTPSQDMILGNYYLTIERSQPDREGRAFKDVNEVEHAYEEGIIDFHTRFVVPARSIGKNFVRLDKTDPDYEEKVRLNEELKDKYLITTYGKTIFNRIFPDSFSYVNVPKRENLTVGTPLDYFVDKGQNYKEIIAKKPLAEPVKKKFLSIIISEVFKQAKLAETSKTLDKMKDIGFYYSTLSGISVSAFDVIMVKNKQQVLDDADEKVKKYNRLYERGLLINDERYRNVVKVWTDATDTIMKEIKELMSKDATTNDIFLMADSGARGSSSNFLQLAGMRGLMAKPNGQSMEIPVRASFREGLSMSEFFISTHGARKGSTDTALKTAESGYLTRRLVDVSQDVIITCVDCGTDKGMYVDDIWPDKSGVIDKSHDPLVPLVDRILGRYSAERITDINENGDEVVIVDRDEFISEKVAARIIEYRTRRFGKPGSPDDKFGGIKIRTILTCNAPNLSDGTHGCNTANGVCVKCYGSDLSTTLPVEKGEVVGIVAAQSIGEPGTQLTMRTFHSGGVAGDDITQGLPRIQELFEAREPKGKGIISEIKGVVKDIKHNEKENRVEITIANDKNTLSYTTDSGKAAVVSVGQKVEAGTQISEGLVHPKELIRVSNVQNVEAYILKEVEKVYRSQGVEISDKHVEIIIKQMLQKVMVIDSGDSKLLPGSYISRSEIYKIIKECYESGKRVPIVKPVILGITRSSLKADSFLSAASFQETTRVLTEAAIRGKKDMLEGLKENIIIGGLIPAGTGLVDEVDVEVPEELNVNELPRI